MKVTEQPSLIKHFFNAETHRDVTTTLHMNDQQPSPEQLPCLDDGNSCQIWQRLLLQPLPKQSQTTISNSIIKAHLVFNAVFVI